MAKTSKKNPALKPLQVLVGRWKTVGHHPMLPGVILKGETSFEWIEGGAFLLIRNHIDHKDFPDGISILGSDDGKNKLYMLYFDERTVSRKYNLRIKDLEWRTWRNDKTFSQRVRCRISEDGNKMVSKGKMARNGKPWEDDLQLSYTRISDNSGALRTTIIKKGIRYKGRKKNTATSGKK